MHFEDYWIEVGLSNSIVLQSHKGPAAQQHTSNRLRKFLFGYNNRNVV